jgi:ABC-type antimicrobial peptide transport system permease subunit
LQRPSGEHTYLVNQGRQEFGIRAALGAQSGDILRIVVSRVGLMAVFGLVLGTLGALSVTRLLDDLLLGVTRSDASSYLAALQVCSWCASPPPFLRAFVQCALTP